jgi:glycosyltransferase involved in cell wall biosynthesis
MDFVSFSLNHWEDLRQSRHEIMGRLARNHKVLFVSPPFYVRDVLDKSRREKLPNSGLVHREDNLYTYVFPKWLFENYASSALNNLFASIRRWQIRTILKKLGFKDLVLFIWNPRFAGEIGAYDEKLTCYYVDDEFNAYYGATKEQKEGATQRELTLLRNADVVLANGTALAERKNTYGKTINLPLGVNYDLFSQARLDETVVPADLAVLPKPRIGYIGNVNDKVDYRLLHYLASSRPDWSIVLVGPVVVRIPEFQAHCDQLKALPNVHFLGMKSQTQLPNYLKGLDVCMMCYRLDGWAYFGYPLKLHEYLAAGKPSVASDLPSIREFEGVIRIAHTREEWASAIQASLQDQSSESRARRVEVARDNRWEARIEVIEELLSKALKKKNG